MKTTSCDTAANRVGIFSKLKNLYFDTFYKFKGVSYKKTRPYKHAITEMDLIGLNGPKNSYDSDMRSHILSMIEEFQKAHHSGYSANISVEILTKLLNHDVLSPLTGEDSEWEKIHPDMVADQSKDQYQNNRFSRVFKDVDKDGNVRTYDIRQKVFWEFGGPDNDSLTPNKYFFTNRDSSVDITFPYVPFQVYAQHKEVEV